MTKEVTLSRMAVGSEAIRSGYLLVMSSELRLKMRTSPFSSLCT